MLRAKDVTQWPRTSLACLRHSVPFQHTYAYAHGRAHTQENWGWRLAACLGNSRALWTERPALEGLEWAGGQGILPAEDAYSTSLQIHSVRLLTESLFCIWINKQNWTRTSCSDAHQQNSSEHCFLYLKQVGEGWERKLFYSVWRELEMPRCLGAGPARGRKLFWVERILLSLWRYLPGFPKLESSLHKSLSTAPVTSVVVVVYLLFAFLSETVSFLYPRASLDLINKAAGLEFTAILLH